jgi:hypothetical protein
VTTSTEYLDRCIAGQEERAATLANLPADELALLLLDRERTIAAWRDENVNTARSNAENLDAARVALREECDRRVRSARLDAVEERNAEIVNLVVSFDRGCSEGKRSFVEWCGMEWPRRQYRITASYYLTLDEDDGEPDTHGIGRAISAAVVNDSGVEVEYDDEE